MHTEGDCTGSLAVLPTSDNPASEYSLKLMLLSLHMQLSSSNFHLHSKIDQVEEHTDSLERQISDHTTLHNEMMNAFD